MLHFVPNRYEVVFLLQLTSILPGQLIFTCANVCEVGREKDEYNEWRWVLPYTYPCDCTRVILGGVNMWTPTRSYKPVYTDRVFLSDDVTKIKEHYGLDCQEKDSEKPRIACPDNRIMATNGSTATVAFNNASVTDNSGLDTTVACNPKSGSAFVIGQTEVECEARDASGNKATCMFMVTACNTRPLGMQKGTILDEQLTASSNDSSHTASKARLNSDSYWLPSGYVNHWISIDLLTMHAVSGIITQGFESWVEYVKILYEEPRNRLVYIKDEQGNNKLFGANDDAETPVTIMFNPPISTTAIQIEPVQCSRNYNFMERCALRLELLGCSSDE